MIAEIAARHDVERTADARRAAPYNAARMRSRLPLSVRVPAISLAASALLAGGAGTALAQSDGGFEASPSAPATPQAAREAAAAKGELRPSDVSLRLKGLRGGRLTAGNKLTAAGTLRPFAKGEKVTILLHRGKKTLMRKTVKVRPKGKGSSLGQFSLSKRLVKPGRYSVQAIHKKSRTLGGSKDRTGNFQIRYPDLGNGADGDVVKTFNRLLARLGYVNDEGKAYDSATGRAVLAFHKVNNLKRTENATSSDFKKLAKGKGGYNLKWPEGGKHVETDLSRQVMVLANGDKVDEIYHISSGAPATPTITGKFNFYRKDAGYNSLGMYYSVYFIRGYATHGYASVPDYPASHGCLRNPIPDAVHIYNWIDIGDPIYVYR